MLEPTRLADYTIWGVALVLYLYDAARMLGPREMLLVEAARGRLQPALGDNPFTSGTRALAFGPVHLPHRGLFVATWGRPWRDPAALAATLEPLAALRGSLGPLRVLAVLAAILLFAVGPLLTLALGADAAVLLTAAGLYPTVAAAIIVLWWRRPRLRLASARAVWLSLEILVCPAFLPNLVRTITAQHPIDADGAQVLVALAGDHAADEFLARLRRRTEDLLDAEGSDPAGQAALHRYLTELGGHVEAPQVAQ
jgi:hypothetical protein